MGTGSTGLSVVGTGSTGLSVVGSGSTGLSVVGTGSAVGLSVVGTGSTGLSVVGTGSAVGLEVESSGASAPPANSVVVVTVLSATVEDVVVGSSTGGSVGLGVTEGSVGLGVTGGSVGGGVGTGGPSSQILESHGSQHRSPAGQHADNVSYIGVTPSGAPLAHPVSE